jgi:hypothetical protein
MLELDEGIKYTRVTEEQAAGIDLGGEGSDVEEREYLMLT